MAQLRDDYDNFQALNTEILVMVPNGPRMITRYVEANQPPYPILSDKGSRVAKEYMQIKHFFSVGTPTVLLVDQSQVIRYAFYGTSIADEPGNEDPLSILQSMQSDGI